MNLEVEINDKKYRRQRRDRRRVHARQIGLSHPRSCVSALRRRTADGVVLSDRERTGIARGSPVAVEAAADKDGTEGNEEALSHRGACSSAYPSSRRKKEGGRKGASVSSGMDALFLAKGRGQFKNRPTDRTEKRRFKTHNSDEKDDDANEAAR